MILQQDQGGWRDTAQGSLKCVVYSYRILWLSQFCEKFNKLQKNYLLLISCTTVMRYGSILKCCVLKLKLQWEKMLHRLQEI